MTENIVSVWWQAALLPDSWDVCGIVVPSLSLWHTFALDNIGNHYLNGGNCTLDDAASLLIFCRHDYSGGRKLMLNAKYRSKQMQEMYAQLKPLKSMDVHLACLDYVRSCIQSARRWQSGKNETNDKCHIASNEQFIVHNRLCRDYRMDIEEAWNTPYSLARCFYDAGAINRGDDSLMSPMEQHLDDELAEKQEKEKLCQFSQN